MFGKKKEEKVSNEKPKSIELFKDDVALILRKDGKCETICTLKGKHSLRPQEELIIGLGGLMQKEKFVNSVREHFMTTMQQMINSKYEADLEDGD